MHFTNLVGQKRQKNSIKNICKLLGTLGPIFQIISWHSYIPMIWKSFNCSNNHNHKKKAICHIFFLTTDHKNTRCLGYSSIYICPHYVVKSIHLTVFSNVIYDKFKGTYYKSRKIEEKKYHEKYKCL